MKIDFDYPLNLKNKRDMVDPLRDENVPLSDDTGMAVSTWIQQALIKFIHETKQSVKLNLSID